MSDLEQYAKEHQVPIMMDGGLKFLLEKLQENQCLSFLELGTAIARTSIEVQHVLIALCTYPDYHQMNIQDRHSQQL